MDLRGERSTAASMHLAAPEPAGPAHSLRVLRLLFGSALTEHCLRGTIWFAAAAPQCTNLRVLHLEGVHVDALPPLPHLAHLLVLRAAVPRALLAPLQGLPRLETLLVHGCGFGDPEHCLASLDLLPCKQLRHVCLSPEIARALTVHGNTGLDAPPGCKFAVGVKQVHKRPAAWAMRLGAHLESLHVDLPMREDIAHTFAALTSHVCHLRHLTLVFARTSQQPIQGSLCATHLLGCLPRSVETLHVDHQRVSTSGLAVVPAGLRALRIKSVCDSSLCRRGHMCGPHTEANPRVLRFGVHAKISRLCLLLWEAEVKLDLLGERGARARIQDLNVQARFIWLTEELSNKVAFVGRYGHLYECDTIDGAWNEALEDLPEGGYAHLGSEPVHLEYKNERGGKKQWPCTCGACCECLGPSVFEAGR